MAIDLHYIASSDLWEVFTDKDTSDFLYGGYVLFFEDAARTVGKPVYMITGSPPAYTFTPYGSYNIAGAWQVDLNSQGAFDNALYYYPFDANGNVDLYFVQWYSSGNVLQNSREAWPPDVEGTSGGGTVVTTNYIPNPQFLFNNTTPLVPPGVLGQITADVTNIAPGWTFERPSGSTAVDVVTFFDFNSPITSPPDNPRYGVEISDTDPNPADTFKYLKVTYPNVNTFASATNTYTFSFWAASTSGTVTVELVLIKNFGSGGSTQTQTTIDTYSISSASYAQFITTTINFGLNTGMTIGANNDDYVALALNFPTSSAFNPVILTDFLLTPGNVVTPVLPDLPEYISTYQAVAGELPNVPTDGFNIGLPIIYTTSGLNYDYSSIGKVFSTFSLSAPQFGELLCDGTSYLTSGYSSDGIPYARLQQKLFNSSENAPITGTGYGFVTTVPATNGTANYALLTTNTAGVTTAISDGTAATGFTFATQNTPTSVSQATGIYATAGHFWVINATVGVSDQALNSGNPFYTGSLGTAISANTVAYGANVQQQLAITFAGIPAGGDWWGYVTPTTGIYVWYIVNGGGADPAPGGDWTVGIPVHILSTFTVQDVARMTAYTLANFQVSSIAFNAASTITGGSFFDFYTLSQPYYVWYKKAGVGTDPAPVGKIGIEVDIGSADTAAQVTTETIIAINSKYFQVPDLRGVFLRGLDPTGRFDVSAYRLAVNNTLGGANAGSLELFSVQSSTVPSANVTVTAVGAVDVWGSGTFAVVEVNGIYETRPVNIAVNYVIKY